MKKRLQSYAIHVGRFTWHVSRWSLYISTAALFLLVLVLGAVRLVLPVLAEQKPDLEQYLTQLSGHKVRIESLHAYWDGIHPGAQAQGLQVYDDDGVKPAIRLSEVRLSIALLPLLWGQVEINSLVVANPSLALERLQDGRFRISGFDPLHASEGAGNEKFVGWLFQQAQLTIENGELQWLDYRDAANALRFSRVNLNLSNSGERHRLVFNAEFPPTICRDCSVILDIDGNPLMNASWNGEMYVSASQVDINNLPLIVREKLPAALRGAFTLQMTSEWEQGRPVYAKGHVQVAGLKLPLPGWDSPLGLRDVSGDLSWETQGQGWRLDVANPRIGLTGPAWAAGHLRIVHQPDKSQIRIKHLDIADITNFSTRIKSELPDDANATATSNLLMDYWFAGKPQGGLSNFDLHFFGDWVAPQDFSLEADIESGSILAYQKYPGVRGLSGHLSLSRHSGSLRVDSTNVAVSLPLVFRGPITARQAQGDIRWEKNADHWLITGNDLRVVSDDATGTGALNLRIPQDKSLMPSLRLRVDFRDGNGAHAARYYPTAYLPPKTLEWMERSFLGGQIKQGYLVYDGPIRGFPFRDGAGKFELQGHVSRATYNFLPGWESIKQGELDVMVNNDRVLVTGSGKLGGLDVGQVVVKTGDTLNGRRLVRVSGKINGPLNETLRVLRDVKPEPGKSRWLGYVPAALQGTGDGVLNLNLDIPLGDARSTDINGEYRFSKNTLAFPGTKIAAEGVEGSVRFTEAGLDSGNLRARFLGGEIILAASQDKGQLRVYGQGTVTAQGLTPLLGSRIAPHVAGSASWKATWRGLKEKLDLQAEAQLNNIKISLPPPLDFASGFPEKLTVQTEPSTRDKLSLSLSMANQANGKLIFARNEEAWRFVMGRIGLGEERGSAPKDNGLHVHARIQNLDLDQWRPYFEGASTGGLELLSRVSADVKSLSLFNRKLGNQYLDFSRQGDMWSGIVSGDSLSGNVKYSGKGSAARLELDLARLTLPDKQPQHGSAEENADPRRLPTVLLRSKSFSLQNKSLGELDFSAAPDASGWAIQRLNLTRPEMKLNVSGNWRLVNDKHSSEFTIGFHSSDVGKTMEAFGVPDQLAGGQVEVKSKLVWPGAPAAPQLATLNGNVEISANKGRFLQVKQGAGRLFGLLDLSAINRYLTFDFSPVFGKGFIYDRIEGQINIEKGNAYTHDFLIRGPATELSANGRVGLVAEDFDLKIELQPRLSDSVTLATWGVWGPQVAAVVLAVQKIFKKQIAAGTRITYVVKGPWEHPEITKSVRQHAAVNVPTKAGE